MFCYFLYIVLWWLGSYFHWRLYSNPTQLCVGRKGPKSHDTKPGKICQDIHKNEIDQSQSETHKDGKLNLQKQKPETHKDTTRN